MGSDASPIGSSSQALRRLNVSEARSDLLGSLAEFMNREPTSAEMEMIDTLLSAFMWNYDGYECVFSAAAKAFRIIHKEEPSWMKKSR